MNRTALTIGLLLTFTVVAAFGVMISMMGSGHEMMSGCPFADGGVAICPMNVVAHIATWQSYFVATIPFLFLGALLALATFFVAFSPRKEIFHFGRFFASFAFIPAPTFLASAFSRGILHPKLYA